jgi:hypothetical protein
VRAARERAIQHRRSRGAPPICQPGLFDRRAVHAVEADRIRDNALTAESRRRITAARLAAALEARTPEIALVLVP